MLESALTKNRANYEAACHNPMQVTLIKINMKDHSNEFDRFGMGFLFRKESRIR